MTQSIARTIRGAVYAIVVLVVHSRGVAHANAAFMFSFEGDSEQHTTFTTTNNGVSATLGSADEMFFVLPTSPLFLTLSGNALFQASTDDTTLNILFDQDLQYVQLLFGSTVPGQLTLTALAQNLDLVGQATASSTFLPGGPNAEGVISFGGSAFRSIDLTFSDKNATFAIDDVTNTPEPATLLLFGFGTIILGCTHKLRHLRP